MLVIYVLLVLQSVLAHHHHHHHHHHRKEKIYYSKADSHFHFEKFIEKHNKNYRDEAEKEARFKIFHDNLIKLNERNEREPHCTFAINQFTDLSTEEFVRQYTGLGAEQDDGFDICKILQDPTSGINVPEAFDWRNHIKLNVKQQLSCGACWAFTATGNIEAQVAIKYNKFISLSEQQLVDCDYSSFACANGTASKAFRYLIQSGGQELENMYPYTSVQGMCQFNSSRAQVRLIDCVNFRFSSEEAIKEALVLNGPITAAVSSFTLNQYSGGVLSDCKYNGSDHAVLVVGYGRDYYENKDYWVIKNSWGAGWGEAGFARIERGVNSCGIMYGSFATSIIM